MEQTDKNIIIHPGRGRSEKTIPRCGLFLVNPTEARIGLQTLLDRGGKRRPLFHSGLVVSPEDDFFVAGPAVGAPMAVMTLEKLIALGADSVIMAGWCGALDDSLHVGDILLGGQAYPGEGTSRYYSRQKVFSPSVRLNRGMKKFLELPPPRPVWSTDAPYRESRPMLAELVRNYSISAVDMEYSALCAVAAHREVDFGALFLVSDELWNRDWRPGFNSKDFKKRSRGQVEALMDHIVAISDSQES